jgi:hypothetical protein
MFRPFDTGCAQCDRVNICSRASGLCTPGAAAKITGSGCLDADYVDSTAALDDNLRSKGSRILTIPAAKPATL